MRVIVKLMVTLITLVEYKQPCKRIIPYQEAAYAHSIGGPAVIRQEKRTGWKLLATGEPFNY
jgi:hypothetical protein